MSTNESAPATTQVFNHGVPWEESYGYSQGFRVGNTIYISGQLAHDDDGNLIGEGDIAAQAAATLDNLEKVLTGLGGRRDQIVETTVLIVGLHENFAVVADAHRGFFRGHRPASTAVGVVELALPGQLVEIAATVRLDL